MIQISSTDSSILVKATEGEYIYPSAKTELELPLNSVILTLDDSEMAVFRSASNFDVLFTAVIDNLQINGASVTKNNIADKFADAATSDQGGFKYEVVDELPSEGEKGTIYLVPNEEGTHTEYLYVENVGWEQVGTAEVDLSDYYTKEEVDEGNRVNAAAFNVLQKSIGLNENLETIDGKSIQAQIDELKEGGSGEQNYFIVDSLDEVENPKEGTYATVKSRDALIEKGAWEGFHKKSVYIIPNTTGKTFTVDSNNGLEITLMYDGSALSLVESEDPTLFDYGEKKTIDGVEYFIVDVKPTDDTIAFVGWDEEEGGEFSIYVMGTIPTKLYKYNGTEWKEAFYEKVDGIDIAEWDEDYEYKQAGIITYTNEEGKWNPEFYLTSDTDWSSYINMYGIDSDPIIQIYSDDDNSVEIHSNRLTVYPSDGEAYDINYSDILTKDNQNYFIVDSLDEIAEPKEGMMAYAGKGDEIIETIGAPKQFEIQHLLDTYLIFDFTRYVYTNDDSFFEIKTSNYGEYNIFTDFRIIADGDISIMTDTDLITIAHQNGLGNEWIFDFDEYVLPKNFFIYTFKVVEFDNRKCLQISYEINPNPTFEQNVAQVRITRLYTNWYFYLFKKSEEEPKTYQYTSGEWKELNADIKEQIGEINTLLENLIG